MSITDKTDNVPSETALTDLAPSVDFSTEVWIGVFPGLGAVSVAEGGEIAVSPDPETDPDPQHLAQRERALYWGWAEPLSWIRRGYRLIDGIVVGPRDETGCMVIIGDYPEGSRLALRLLASGWALLSDRPSPHTLVDGILTAHPRPAPMLIARARALKDGLSHESVRTDSDAVSTEVDRLTDPRRVSALVFAGVRRPHEETLQVLTGQEKFRLATGLFVRGPSKTPSTAEAAGDSAARAKTLAEHLALANHPILRLRRTKGTDDTGLNELLDWWRQHGENS